MATYRSNSLERKFVAGEGGVTSGQIIAYGGKHWISQNLKTVPEGEMASSIQNAVVEIEKTSAATTYDDGDEVEINIATQKTVASGGVVCGLARGASGSTNTTVTVALNEHLGQEAGSA